MFRTALLDLKVVTPLFSVPARVTLFRPLGRCNWSATKT